MMVAKIQPIILWLILIFVYFFLRLSWPETIEFGYDQPLLALKIMKVIENKDFINAAAYININNTIPDTVTWGPFLIYFLTPFFLISHHPIIISQLIGGFNILGIIFTYLLGKKLFGRKVGIFSAFFLAVFPWSVIFSRMVYQPTPLITFIPLMMYVTILIQDKKYNYLLLLPAIWSMVLQFHLLSLSVVSVSFIFLIINWRKISWTKFILGIFISLILWLPLIKTELDRNFYLIRGSLRAPFLLWNKSLGLYRDQKGVLDHSLAVLSGKDFEFQLDVGYKDFLNSLPLWMVQYQKIFMGLFLTSLIFLILRLIIKRRKNDLLIFLWLISVPFFIYLLRLPEALPRYFLMIIPAEGLLLGLFLEKTISFVFKNAKINNYLFSLITLLIICSNSFFIIKYYNFILQYNYPQEGWMGWLSRDSDPPFSFLYHALDFCLKNTQKNGLGNIVFSDDLNVKDRFQVNAAQEYTWRYVFKENFDQTSSATHYFILRGLVPDYIPPSKVRRFGPYSVYKPEY